MIQSLKQFKRKYKVSNAEIFALIAHQRVMLIKGKYVNRFDFEVQYDEKPVESLLFDIQTPREIRKALSYNKRKGCFKKNKVEEARA